MGKPIDMKCLGCERSWLVNSSAAARGTATLMKGLGWKRVKNGWQCPRCSGQSDKFKKATYYSFDDPDRDAIRICTNSGCTFGPGGVKHGSNCPEAGKTGGDK